jgi:hypothetical protein
MSMQKSGDSSSRELLRNSSLYREFQAEREEILKHKWIESEKAGYDIGFERALTDWIIKHRSKWRKSRQERLAEPEQTTLGSIESRGTTICMTASGA